MLDINQITDEICKKIGARGEKLAGELWGFARAKSEDPTVFLYSLISASGFLLAQTARNSKDLVDGVNYASGLLKEIAIERYDEESGNKRRTVQ